MRIAYNNVVDSIASTSIFPLTVNVNYPIVNIQNQRLAVRYRSTAVTAQSIVFDFGSAVNINTFAILGHNISTAATITVSANSSDSWPGATSQTLTGNVNMILKFFAQETYRYWKLSIDDPTNTDGYIEIGRIWAGTYLDISPSSLLDFSVTKKRSDMVTYGRGRQKFSSEGIGWRKLKFTFPKTNYSMIRSIETLFDYVGIYRSFIFCNFDTDRNYELVEPCYCSFNKELEFQHVSNMMFEYSFEFEEDL